jgi:hypothetical protein
VAMRSTARRALACEQEAAELEAQLDRLVRRLAPLTADVPSFVAVCGETTPACYDPSVLRPPSAVAQLKGQRMACSNHNPSPRSPGLSHRTSYRPAKPEFHPRCWQRGQ